MRIKNIEIKGLFGRFNHTIPLNLDSHITIIYGENGIGKTMIFKLLSILFSSTPKNRELFLTKYLGMFETLTIQFEASDKILYLEQHNLLTIDYEKNDFDLKILYISSERLTYFDHSTQKAEPVDNIFILAEEFSEKISTLNQKYKSKSDELKNSIMERVVEKDVDTDLSEENLKILIEKITHKRKKLTRLGVLSEDLVDFPNPKKLKRIEKAILAVTLQDIEAQLKVYDEDNFLECLELFMEILNERRFSFKSITASETRGFKIVDAQENSLSASQLSTGEQHQLIILYELLFRTKPNTLVLLDEPEISLHVVWLQPFVEDMKKIIALKGFDLLVATHSPDLVNGEWDLTVPLKADYNEQA